MIPSSNSEIYSPVPAGEEYIGALTRIYYLGHHPYQTTELDENGKQKPVTWSPKVKFGFEINYKRDGRSVNEIVMTETFTLSVHQQSKLKPFLSGWLKTKMDDFLANQDLERLLGHPSLVTVEHRRFNDNTGKQIVYAAAIPSNLPSRYEPLQVEGELIFWSLLTPGAMSDERIPRSVRQRAEKSREALANNLVCPPYVPSTPGAVNQSQLNDTIMRNAFSPTPPQLRTTPFSQSDANAMTSQDDPIAF